MINVDDYSTSVPTGLGERTRFKMGVAIVTSSSHTRVNKQKSNKIHNIHDMVLFLMNLKEFLDKNIKS